MRPPRLAALPVLVALELWATRSAWLSPVERLALMGVSAATLGAAALTIGWWTRRAPLWLLLLVSAASAAALLWLPQHWYPSLHTLLALAATGVIGAQLAPRRALALFAVLTMAAAGLLRLSTNLRFVALVQAPLAGPILDGVSRLRPNAAIASTAAAARRPPLSPTDWLPALGDAHILLITVDALRADRLGPHTPNLNALASHGLRFTHAYAQAPSTAISLSSLMTGAPPDRLRSAPPTLAEILRGHHWRSESFYPAGLFFDGRGQLDHYARTRFGFQWADTRTLDALALTDAVLARVDALQRDGEPRAFFWLHYFDAHEPYVTHPGLTEGDSAQARYDGEVAFVDRELGRLLDGLHRLRRPLIICVTADHGEELGEHGGAYHGSTVYEEQVRVPLVIVAPGVAPRVVDDLVELTDVFPSLLALAGLAPPQTSWGHDAHSQVGTLRMLVRGDWKLIHDRPRDVDALYDLSADPGERHNLYDQRRQVAAPLHAALDQWFGLATIDSLERTLANPAAPTVERAAAARQLGEDQAFSARPSLRVALDDPDLSVRGEAALALGEMTDRAATGALLSLLALPEWRHRASLKLGRLRDARALPELVATLDDISPALRREAANYLGWLGDATTVPSLVAAAGDVRVRGEAFVALGRIASRIHDPAIVRFLSTRLAEEPHEDARASLHAALSLAQ